MKIGQKVKIKNEHSHITEVDKNVIWKIYEIIKEGDDTFYQIESPLGLKFSANDFEIKTLNNK